MDETSGLKLKTLLASFCSQDEAESARAFEALSVITRRGLNAYLRDKVHSEDSRQDVIQDVLRRIWIRRTQFDNRGPAAWWALVKLAADQCRVDLIRKVGPEVSWDESELGDIPETELNEIDSLLEALDEREDFYRAADEVFLGVAAMLDDRDRARRVLAAQLFFVEGMSWEEVCSILNRSGDQIPVTRSQLDIWLNSASATRCLAFRTLYVDNERLTAHLLGIDTSELAQLNPIYNSAIAESSTAEPPKGLRWAEVRVIFWRYRDAERPDRILAHELCEYDKAELLLVFDRCLENFPFTSIMKQLAENLSKWPKAQKELADPGIWQRLVLEYYCRDCTSQRDIFDRTHSAAAMAPYHLTMGMLNVWLSNGRLVAKIADHIRNKKEPQ